MSKFREDTVFPNEGAPPMSTTPAANWPPCVADTCGRYWLSWQHSNCCGRGGMGGGFLVICVSERPRDPIGIHSCHPHLSLHPPFHEYCALLKIQKSENINFFLLEIVQFSFLFITRKWSNMYILHILGSYLKKINLSQCITEVKRSSLGVVAANGVGWPALLKSFLFWLILINIIDKMGYLDRDRQKSLGFHRLIFSWHLPDLTAVRWTVSKASL